MTRTRRWAILVASLVGVTAVGLMMASTVLFNTQLRPLPIEDAERVVQVLESQGSRCPQCPELFAYATYQDWKDATPWFVNLSAYTTEVVSIAGGQSLETVTVAMVDSDFFNVLRVQPAQGRVLLSDDFISRSDEPAAVVSHDFRSPFADGNQSAIGTTIELGERRYVVVGVMPFDFRVPTTADVWVPLEPRHKDSTNDGEVFWGVARLSAQTTPGAARNAMLALQRQRAEEGRTATSAARGIIILSMEKVIRGSSAAITWIFFGMMIVAVLAMTTNLGTMALLRGIDRSHEVAIRIAVGATPGSLVRLFLWESAIPAFFGVVVGVIISMIYIDDVISYLSATFGVSTDWRVSGLAATLTITVAVLMSSIFGWASYKESLRGSQQVALKTGGPSSAVSRQTERTRNVLVAAQVCLTFCAITVAGLLVKSYLVVQTTDLGYATDGLTVVRFDFRHWRYGSDLEHARELLARAARNVSRLGQVRDVVLLNNVRTRVGLELDEPPVTVEGVVNDYPYEAMPIESSDGTPRLLDILEIPLIRGRSFDESDNAASESVVVINQLAAEGLWPGQDALGKRFKLGPSDSRNPWLTVVGVVDNTYPLDVAGLSVALYSKRHWPLMFRPLAQTDGLPNTMFIKTHTDVPKSLVIDAVMRETYDPIVRDVTPISSLLLVGNLQYIPALSRAFFFIAFLAVGLALTGVYSVTAHRVKASVPEIGIRMALGATPRDIMTVAMRHILLLGAAGISVGLIAVAMVTSVVEPVVRQYLHGTRWNDPLILIGAVIATVVVCLVAAFGPIRQAGSVDPAHALRDLLTQ